jgi:hypothetical protein
LHKIIEQLTSEEMSMANESEKRSYTTADDENITAVMAYTDKLLIWGNVITKKALRVSTWLRTQAVPQFIWLHDATILEFSGGAPKTQTFSELFLPSSLVLAFHIKPPASDPLDYDPNEPMRKMTPATALIGWFRFDGYLRMSTHTELERFLDVSKETFISIYDLAISQPSLPSMGVIRVPMALIRSVSAIYAAR